jgi:hypothetical protein
MQNTNLIRVSLTDSNADVCITPVWTKKNKALDEPSLAENQKG